MTDTKTEQALVVAGQTTTGPSIAEVMREVFKDLAPPNDGDNCHWIVFKNGTFYTFAKLEFGETPNTADLMGRALTMCDEATLVSHDDENCVTVLPYREEFGGHPVYVILSVLRAKIGWVIVGKTDQWAETEQQLAAVGYLARTNYELDCEEKGVLATSWD